MKNKIIIIDKNNKKCEYDPIIKVSTSDKEYLVYTDNKKNKMGDTIFYVSSYEYLDGVQVLDSISDYELEVIDKLFTQVLNKEKKMEGNL